LKGRNNP